MDQGCIAFPITPEKVLHHWIEVKVRIQLLVFCRLDCNSLTELNIAVFIVSFRYCYTSVRPCHRAAKRPEGACPDYWLQRLREA